MHRSIVSILQAMSLIPLIGCSSVYAPGDATASPLQSVMAEEMPDARYAATLDDASNGNSNNSSLAPSNTAGLIGNGASLIATKAEPTRQNRKKIYTAKFSILVSTLTSSIEKLKAAADSHGGYISRRSNSSLVVRIPAARFEEFTATLPRYGRVLSESMNARDVTAQHTDLTIRLENAERARKRLLALLDKAAKMQDILKIEESLRRLTTDIERMKGQLKLLDHEIAFSTVTVEFKSNAPQAKTKRQRSRSRFPWINQIGIEQDLRRRQP